MCYRYTIVSLTTTTAAQGDEAVKLWDMHVHQDTQKWTHHHIHCMA